LWLLKKEAMMNEMDHSSTCDRADDLVSVLYGEASEPERRDFELHMKQCGNCRAEFAAFAQVRESIGEWREEALSGFVSSQTAPLPVRKSALAALRQFFDLSPLWMKGAVAFAAVVFCVLAALAVGRLQSSKARPAQVAAGNPDAVYTKQDVERMVQEALAKQTHEQAREQRVVEPKPITVESPAPKNSTLAKSVRMPKAQRPFSRAEREQLAAELRLLSGRDELELLGDRINK
jgi:hypothetical protein